MILRSRIFIAGATLAALIGTGWYFLLFPQEVWIRYNFIARADEINSLADFWEGQDSFQEFSCIGDDVWLDMRAAPGPYHEILRDHCRSARIVRGELTDAGSWYYLGEDTKWLDDFWIAAIREPNLDVSLACSRWRKPEPREECIVFLSGYWAIHYLNITGLGEDVDDLAEDVVEREGAP